MTRSDYSYRIRHLNGHRVAIILDNDRERCRSVTNDIENVAKELGVVKAIYRDSMGIWDFWSKDMGFKTLAVRGAPTTQQDVAEAVAVARYIKKEE